MAELFRIRNKDKDWDGLWNVVCPNFNSEPHGQFLIDREYYALKEKGSVIGAAIAEAETRHIVALYNVSVLPEKQRQGYGSEMLAKLSQTLSEKFRVACLYCKPELVPFYDAAGFEIDRGLVTTSIQRMYKKLG